MQTLLENETCSVKDTNRKHQGAGRSRVKSIKLRDYTKNEEIQSSLKGVKSKVFEKKSS